MRDGFIKVAAATPEIRVADPAANAENILRILRGASDAGAKVVVFPELCISGYTCGDLFLQDTLLESCMDELYALAKKTESLDMIYFLGIPVMFGHKLYNCAAAVSGGRVLGFVPKTFIPNYSEFYEGRYFNSWGYGEDLGIIESDKGDAPIGTGQLFTCDFMPELVIGAEICEDLWAPKPPSIDLALAGAALIVNLSASDELTGKDLYRKNLVAGQSARLLCGYIYADAGEGESTQDVVYAGHNIIAENGKVLGESRRFESGLTVSEIDVKKLISERRRISTFVPENEDAYAPVGFTLQQTDTELTRYIDPAPFVPSDEADRVRRCEEILSIQAAGLKKRLKHTGAKSAVVGISGGLDSTLALIVTVRAFDMLGLSRDGITAITMPGFGTTDRTYENACTLVKSLGATLKEISIADAVRQHFSDIGQDESVHDVTYENSQARERTQILMDYANKTGALVVGTGDLSELALGWATYNGDHMSMYGVNASVPKTLVRHLVRYYADTCGQDKLQAVLVDILDTPVSPELIPPKDGEISQKTEDLVGPYELHDFFLYYVMRFGMAPSKIYRLAKQAFCVQDKVYDEETILKWLKTFYRRFFSQQFKRSCLPDGPKVGSVALSPRGDWRMPSDACVDIWMRELEESSR